MPAEVLRDPLALKLPLPHAESHELKERPRLLRLALAAEDDELQRLRRELSTFSRTSLAPVPEQRDPAGRRIAW